MQGWNQFIHATMLTVRKFGINPALSCSYWHTLQTEALMSAFDVIFVDDEVSLTEIFQHYVLARYKNWRFTTFNNAAMAYKEIVSGHLSSTVWIIDLMMPGKNGVQ